MRQADARSTLGRCPTTHGCGMVEVRHPKKQTDSADSTSKLETGRGLVLDTPVGGCPSVRLSIFFG